MFSNTASAIVAVGVLGAAGYMAGRWLLTRGNLRGKTVLVTGGSRGLGLLLAREYGRAGCRVAICARRPEELDRAKLILENTLHEEVLAVTCDVADADQVERMVNEVTERFGRIDVLVNNAGIIQAGPVASMTRSDFERAMNVMFWGMYNCTFAVLPQMRARRSGQIVNITSIGGIISVPHMLPYNCAKFAGQGLSEGLSAELRREGIYVTTVAPGMICNGSYVNAEFKGDTRAEFNWFASSASMPLLSKSADGVAREIVGATKRKEAVYIVSLPASVAARVHGLMPGTVNRALSLANRFLPSSESQEARSGHDIEREGTSKAITLLTSAGRKKGKQINERSN